MPKGTNDIFLRGISILTGCMLLLSQAYGLDLTVRVEGVDSAVRDTIKASLSIEKERTRSGLTVSRMNLLYKEALSEIPNAMRPFGYFKPIVESQLEQFDGAYTAIFRITPGPKVKISRVNLGIQGAGETDASLQANFPLHEGDDLDQTAYEQAKQSTLSKAIRKGYLDARYIKHELRVDLQSYTATIELVIETGEHYLFGEVRFKQDFMNPEFLSRYVEFAPGDSFDQEKLLTLQSNLVDSEYFSHVEVGVQRDQAVDRQVPVDIVLTPNKPNRYRIGLGYATDIGPRLTLDHNRRRIGMNGKHMHSELSLAEQEQKISSEFIIPLERPAKDYLSFGASHNRARLDTHKSLLTTVNAKHIMSLEDKWVRTLGLDYSYESFEVADQKDRTLFLVPNVRWNRISADNKRFVQRGSLVDLYLEGALDQVLSSATYLQGVATTKWVHGFADDNWRFLTRLKLGATQVDQVTDLPASKRFFAGGDNSIRGFDLDQLGPKTDTGEVVGGRYLAVGSLELERRIVGNWSAAAFFDTGNAFDPDYSSSVEYGVGFGVRWNSPVGAIRLDLAKGLDRITPQYRVHITIGPVL